MHPGYLGNWPDTMQALYFHSYGMGFIAAVVQDMAVFSLG